MSDLYRCDYRALMAPPCLPFETLEIDLGADDIPMEHDLTKAFRDGREDYESSGLVRLVVTNETDRQTLYFTNGVLHRDDGPARIMESPKTTSFVFYRNGERHREEGPALIVFTRTDINGWTAPEFTDIGNPDEVWGGIRMFFMKNNEQGTKVAYLGVNQWYPDEHTMFMCAHRVAFQASDRKDFVAARGNVVLRRIELPHLREVWEHDQLTARIYSPPELKWFVPHVNVNRMENVSERVNAWMEKNMEGTIDPYHPDLFTDPVDEFAFLSEFGSI